MSTSADVRAKRVEIRDRTTVVVHLVDGRSVEQPIARFPRLVAATAAELGLVRLIGDGEGIRWPAVDEDLSVRGFVRDAVPSRITVEHHVHR